jgi:glycogen debranching enzyme
MMKKVKLVIFSLLLMGCATKKEENTLAEQIRTNEQFQEVKQRALAVVKTGFNAGDGYREVWIRDYNTFIELSAEVYPAGELKENLLVFFRMQGDDGNIIDGFTPAEKIGEGETDFSYSELEPRYAGHKNTVETDQETSLIQTVFKYVRATGDRAMLDIQIGDKTVAQRMEWAMQFLMDNRFSTEYGLIWGATTADWGDVQPEHGWGVDIDGNTHRAIDIYDNAMFIIALDHMMELLPHTKEKWLPIRHKLAENTRKHLWDSKNQKFIPHLYLNGSPFPEGFNENEIYYFGGTAVAIEAGLLNEEEIKRSIDEMVLRVKQAGAASIGLTLYPPYPNGFFVNKIMNPEYSYQNGGDWTWFGARMVEQLVNYGFVEDAYEQILPMTERVVKNDGFYEWYTVDNKPKGSGTFRGSAGVLYTALLKLEHWANSQNN